MSWRGVRAAAPAGAASDRKAAADPLARLKPVAVVDDALRAKGMRTLTVEVIFSTLCDSVMGGVILTAFALHLGATNTGIGLLAAVTYWNQLLQAPGVVLVERLRMRKAIAVFGSLVSSLAPVALMVLALAPPAPGLRWAAIGAVALYSGAGSVAGCAWNAWVRDLVPGDRRGRFFGRRSTLSTAVAMAASLLAAGLLDHWTAGSAGRGAAFAAMFAVGFLAQLASASTLARGVEPQMPPGPDNPERLLPLLAEPLRNPEFRKVVVFLASWQFAVNLAQPFFTVFFLRQLGFKLEFVMVLTLTAQLANLLTLSRWGALIDLFGAKSVLNVAAPTFILCIAAMIGASQIASHVWAGAYLVMLHLVMGTASAGVTLATGNIVMKRSPRGRAESYIAANALACAAAAGLAPLLGGLCADVFAARRFALTLQWAGPHFTGNLLHLQVRQWDFYFLISALVGLYALHRLTLVPSEGDLAGKQMLHELFQRARAARRRFTAVGAIEALGEVPAGLLGKAERRRTARSSRGTAASTSE